MDNENGLNNNQAASNHFDSIDQKYSHILIIIGISISLALILASILYLYLKTRPTQNKIVVQENYSLVAQLDPKITNTILIPTNFAITNTPTTNPIADWKKLSRSDIPFSILIPPNLEICPDCNISGPANGPSAIFTLYDKSSALDETDKAFDGISFYVEKGHNFANFKTYLDDQKTQFQSWGGGENAQEKSIIFGKNQSTVLVNFAWDKITRVYFPQKNFILIVSFGQSNSDFKNIAEKIIETIEFL